MSVAPLKTAAAERRRATEEKRRQIVETAVAIADAEGLEAVTMRRLAMEVGLAPMSIYTYVARKDELLDLMRDRVAAEMLLPAPLPGEWRPALRAIAIRTRKALEAHPWSLDADPHRPRRRINTMRHIEQSLGVVVMLGAEGRSAAAVLMAVDDYVLGHCLRKRARERMVAALEEQGELERTVGEEPDPEVEAALAAGELPVLEEVFKRRGKGGPLGVPPKASFDEGLEWLLDGIEAWAAERGLRGASR